MGNRRPALTRQALASIYTSAGRPLLDAARDALRAAGCRQAFLYTCQENETALPVYESAGYRRDGSVRESDFRGVHLREPPLVKLL